MSLLSSQTLRALGVAAIAFLALVVSMFGYNADAFTSTASKLLDAGLALATAAGGVWAVIARVKLANPPLTQAAADQHVAILADQGKVLVPTTAAVPVPQKTIPTQALSHWIVTGKH